MMTRALMGTAVAALLIATPGLAQDPPPPPPQQTETELVFEREIFRYPTFQRRNPFRPLVGAAGGVRFEQLSLIGIVYSPDQSGSVAVLTTGGVQVAEDGTTSPIEGDSYQLKVGQTVGNTRIVQIRRDAVVVDVTLFDEVERHTMTLESRRDGGTP